MPVVSDDFEFEDVPALIEEYTRRSRMAIHPPGFLPWAHPVLAHVTPHGHTIMEDLPSDMKNQIADHIETYHKNRRYDASE
jgi:hypothetical protein